MDPNTFGEIPGLFAALYAIYIVAAVWRSRSLAPGQSNG